MSNVPDFSNCSSTCRVGGHENWGECVRAKNIKAQWLGGTGPSQSGQKAWDRENERFAKATKEGLSPQGVGNKAIDAAYRAAEG